MFTQKYVLWKPVYSWIFDIGNKKSSWLIDAAPDSA